MVRSISDSFKEEVGVSLLDDFKQGRELQKKYVEKQQIVATKQKKQKPNRLLLGLGIAYEMLQVEKITTGLKEGWARLKKTIVPIFLVMFDDIKKIKHNPNEETSFHRWQVKEKFTELGKRFRR